MVHAMTAEEFSEALTRLEFRRQLDIAAFLGISQSKASEYRSGKNRIPKYIALSIQSNLMLSPEQVKALKQLRGINT